MPSAGRLGDNHTGHGCFPPTPCDKGSSNVIVNGKPAMRVGDTFVTHCCPNKGCHTPVLAKGSSTVIVNGRKFGRIGDKVACGGAVMVGSSNVIVGG